MRISSDIVPSRLRIRWKATRSLLPLRYIAAIAQPFIAPLRSWLAVVDWSADVCLRDYHWGWGVCRPALRLERVPLPRWRIDVMRR